MEKKKSKGLSKHGFGVARFGFNMDAPNWVSYVITQVGMTFP